MALEIEWEAKQVFPRGTVIRCLRHREVQWAEARAVTPRRDLVTRRSLVSLARAAMGKAHVYLMEETHVCQMEAREDG